MKNTVCTALMLLMSVCMYAQELYGEYEKKVYVSSQGDSLKYRLLRPEAEKAGKKLIVGFRVVRTIIASGT
jgi:hypothetical protein